MMLFKKMIIFSFCFILLLSCAIDGNVNVSNLSQEVEASASVNRDVRGGKFIGMITASYVPAKFSDYWNQVTPENGGKWGSVEKSRDKYSWNDQDTAYNYAKSNGFPFKAHCLVWGSQQPGWISNLSKSEQAEEVEEWIRDFAKRYPACDYVDVVNEPLHAAPSYKEALGGAGSTGWDWVVWSFEKARKYFPRAKLILNDYGIINDTNAANKYIAIINILKKKNLIDGIGIQCHQFNVDNLSTSTMKKVLDMLGGTGLPVYVSELDITGDDATQLSRYKDKFPVLYNHSAVRGITFWGWIQGETWKANTHLMTSSGKERPALTWLKNNYLKKGSSSSSQSSSSSSSTSSSSSSSTGGDYKTVSLPFTHDGAGEFFWKFKTEPGNINSWSLDLLEINGKDITNQWIAGGSLPAKKDGYYYVHCIAPQNWSHVEIK